MKPENKLIFGTLLGVVGFYVILGGFKKISYSNQVGENPGDGISTFSETGELLSKSKIGSEFMPQEFRMNSQEQESCEYLNTTLHHIEVDANFADTQEELDELEADMLVVYKLKEDLGCL
tara:strand:- start:2009 stop:2368 length:360 start_codon:yes stop_codon:yes gene_type:complete